MRKNERFQTKQVVMAVGTAAFLVVLAGGACASARGGVLYASAQEGTLAEQEVPDASLSVNGDGVSFEPYDERDAYDRLVSYRIKDYEKMSVAEFNATLCNTEDEFGRLLDANAQVAGTLSREDENYDFLENTMSVSLSELYCEKFGETYGRAVVLSRQERPYGKDEDGETVYAFWLYADLWVSYFINEPEKLTVGARNHALQAMKDGLQDYIDGMSEEQLAGGDVRKLLGRKSAELAKELSGDNMKLWCEVQIIDASWDERIL